MFNYIKNIYNNLYNILLGQALSNDINTKSDTKSETESEYIERRLNNWKVKMFSENVYLTCIPEKRILAERKRLQKEYNAN